jgi:hypothetical protein
MRKKLMLSCLLVVVLAACKKDHVGNVGSLKEAAKDTLSVDIVKEWWQENAHRPANETQSLNNKPLVIDWSSAKSFQTDSGMRLSVLTNVQPGFNNIRQGCQKLLFQRGQSGSISAHIVDIIPDALYLQRTQKLDVKTFTGRIFYYDLDKKLLGGLIFGNGQRIGTIKPTNINKPKLHTDLVQVSEDCYWHDSNYISADGELVVFSEKICTYNVTDFGPDTPANLPDGGGGAPPYSGGGSGASAAPPMSNLPGENGQKIDPKSYMDCFKSLPDIGSKMTVTVYVQEPAPGLPFNVGQNSVGHTAIGLTKTYNGQSITQVVGFYPDATGKSKAHAPSKILDNSDLNTRSV